MQQVQLYDDKLDFEENKSKGPFGDYANDEIYINDGKPKYDFFGIPVYSPFGIAAGPLPATKFIKAALDKGYDIVTLKSVRTNTFPLNPYPQVRPVQVKGDLKLGTDVKILVANSYTQPLAITNSFGIPSVTPSEWQPIMRESLKLPKKGQILLAAFQGTARGKGREDFVNDHVKGVKLIRDTGAKVIEINLSCPNEGEAVLACFDTDITERIVNAVREANPDLKFTIKTTYFTDHKQLKDLVKRVGNIVDGFGVINTISTSIIDKNGKEVYPGRPTAGVSGSPIKWAGLKMTSLLNQFREEFGYKYKIMGMGGVLTPSDFHEYIKAGADTVMAVTGPMFNPKLAQEIKASL
ncbi:MAG TPA: dihydroorotate oxidase [Patescibacteria group bacterium]|nr:dihydroorotate oxidase [Patescibacteria group bacterium]